MSDERLDPISIYDSRAITTAVYKNDFTAMFPFILTSFGTGRKVEYRLMNAKEQKMIIALIACAKANSGREVRLPFDVFKTITGDKSHYSRSEYEQYLFYSMKTLQSGFCTYDEHTKMVLPLFSRASGIDSSSKEIVFSISEDFVALFNDIEKNFTVVQLSEILPLIGRYTIVLYRLLIQWDSVGQVKIPMSEIARQMLFPPSYAGQTMNITRRAIKPSVMELRNKVERFADLDYRYDHKYKPDNILFSWKKPNARMIGKNNAATKQLEDSIQEALLESNSSQVSEKQNHVQQAESTPIQRSKDAGERDDWKTYIPAKDEVLQYAAQNGYSQYAKAGTFLVYCKNKLKKYGTWEKAGFADGWKDYFIVFSEKESSYTEGRNNTKSCGSVPLPAYMSKPLPDSRQPSEELLDKVRKMQNDLKN